MQGTCLSFRGCIQKDIWKHRFDIGLLLQLCLEVFPFMLIIYNLHSPLENIYVFKAY